MQRGVNHQSRPYRGDYLPGDQVGIFFKYEGKQKRARYLRGYVVAEAQPKRHGQVVSDKVWVTINGRFLCINKEQLRDPTGSEYWTPSEQDFAELKRAEVELKKTRVRERQHPSGEDAGHDPVSKPEDAPILVTTPDAVPDAELFGAVPMFVAAPSAAEKRPRPEDDEAPLEEPPEKVQIDVEPTVELPQDTHPDAAGETLAVMPAAEQVEAQELSQAEVVPALLPTISESFVFETPRQLVFDDLSMDRARLTGAGSSSDTIAGDAPQATENAIGDLLQPDTDMVDEIHTAVDKRDRPEDFTPATEPPAHRPKFSAMEVAYEKWSNNRSIQEAGCPIKIDVEQLADGCYQGELEATRIRVSTMTDYISHGKHSAANATYPFVSIYGQSEPGAGWQMIDTLVLRRYVPRTLDKVFYKVVTVFHHRSPASHQVLMTKPGAEEFALQTDSDDDAAEKKNTTGIQLVPKKLRKQLDKELPLDLIPAEQLPLYEAALEKEWAEWLGWDAVDVLPLRQSLDISRDPDRRKKIIPTRVAYRNKHAARDPRELMRLGLDLIKAKARLCLQGFRQHGKHKLRRDSPTLSRCGFFMILQIVASFCMELFGGDLKSAFMQGGAGPKGDGEDEIYLSQPRNGKLPGLVYGQLLQLKGSAYGKVNAPRLWWRKFVGFLVSSGWHRHSMDATILMLYDDCTPAKLIAIIGVHVDDVIGGCVSRAGIQHIRDAFLWGEFNFGSLTFCGREIVQRERCIRVTQQAHNEAIEITKLPRARRAEPESDLTATEASDLISGIGTLQWVGSNTSPPMQAAVSLTQSGEGRTVETLMKVHALLREVREEASRGLDILDIDLSTAVIACFGDGSWANAKGYRTQSGYVIYVAEPESLSEVGGRGSIVDWRSHKLRRACHSTIYAEAMSSRAAAAAATWMRQMFLETVFKEYKGTMSVSPEKVPEDVSTFLKLHVITDCNSLHETVIKSGLPEDKRAALEVIALREMVEAEEVFSDSEVEADTQRLKERDLSDVYRWCVSEDQKGDILTKLSVREEREIWHDSASWISIRSKKKLAQHLRAEKAIPSRPRPPLDKEQARLVLLEQRQAAEQAGFR